MTDAPKLPAPPVPPDCDGAALPWMPLHGDRLFRSDFDAEANDGEFRAAMNLWWSAWRSCPAASLADSDSVLCKAAGLGRDLATWRAVRDQAMRGFILCSDSRWYHVYLSGLALDALDLRKRSSAKRGQDRKRLERWREAKRLQRECNAAETHVETRVVARIQHSTSQHIDSCPTAPNASAPAASPKRAAEKRQPANWKSDPSFVRFWESYPRKIDAPRAFIAWGKAIKGGAKLEVILAGLSGYAFSPDPQFIPHPATWLSGCRWEFEPAASPSAPAPRPLRTANGVVLTDEQLFSVAT